MMRRMNADIVKLLEEIVAEYERQGITDPQAEIGGILGVNQSTVSKWLTGVNRPNRYSAPIISLYHDVTGNTINLPVVATKMDVHAREVVNIMQQLDAADREIILNLARSMLGQRAKVPSA